MSDNPRSEAARLLGQARTAAKAQAARINGRKGGRPRVRKTDSEALAEIRSAHPTCGHYNPAPRPVIVAGKPKEND